MRSPLGFISELDCYLFGNGTHYSIYEKLGAHPATIDGILREIYRALP